MAKKVITKRPPKTLKERRFVKEYIVSGNATQAALKVYDTDEPRTAQAIGSQNLSKLLITDVMEKAGLTDDKLVSDLVDGLGATKVLSANIYANGEGGKPINDFIETPDYAVRHKWWNSAMQLKGHLKDEDSGTRIQNNFLSLTDEQLASYLQTD